MGKPIIKAPRLFKVISLIILLIFLSISFFYPVKSLITIVIFYPEHLFFINNIVLIYFWKSTIDYAKMAPKSPENGNGNWDSVPLFLIWIELCKLNAFNRTYGLFLKQKPSWFDLFKSLTALYFNIPLKLITLLKSLTKSNSLTLRESLLRLHREKWNSCHKLVIEVFNGQILLNCYSIHKFVRELQKINPNITSQKCEKLIFDIKKISQKQSIFALKLKNEELPFNLQSIHIKPNFIIKPHYALKHQGVLIHATSNKLFSPLESQIIRTALPLLTLATAIDPRTVISTRGEIRFISTTQIQVPKYEVEMLCVQHPTIFTTSSERKLHFWEKHGEITAIFDENLGIIPSQNHELYPELIMGHYSPIILMTPNSSISEIIKDIIE